MIVPIVALLTTVLAIAGEGLIEQAPSKAVTKSNPFAKSESAIRAGAKLFERECSGCHGKSLQGSAVAPPLATSRVREAPPGAIFWVIRNGDVFHGMPSFAHLPEPQRWQIVGFVQKQ